MLDIIDIIFIFRWSQDHRKLSCKVSCSLHYWFWKYWWTKKIIFLKNFMEMSSFFKKYDDVIKKMSMSAKIFLCQIVHYMIGNYCTNFHGHSNIGSRDIRGGGIRLLPVQSTSKKPGMNRVKFSHTTPLLLHLVSDWYSYKISS